MTEETRQDGNDSQAIPVADAETSPAPVPSAFSRRPFLDRLLGAFSLVLPLVLYYITTCPVVYFGDAGELTAAAYRWGVAHPPGYPAYIISLAIFLRLPLSWLAPRGQFLQPIAWQANFLSAVFGALTIWIVYLIVLRLVRKPFLALAAALLVATGRTLWSQTGIAEVYTLNAFLSALMVLLAVVQSEKPAGSMGRIVFLRLGSLVWGLMLSNHHESAFFFPLWLTMLYLALLPSIEKRRPALPHVRIILDAVLFLGLGLLPYLYLPIAASMHPPLNWGDPSNLPNFIKVLTRAEYRHVKALIKGDLVTSRDIFLGFRHWTRVQYLSPLLVLAIPGFGSIFKRSPHRPVLIATALSIFLLSAAFIVYFAGIDRSSMFFLEVYFIPWYIALGVLVTVGAELIASFAESRSRVRGSIWAVGACLLVLVEALLGFQGNFKTCDMRDNIAGYVYSHDVIATLPSPPQRNVLITGGDEIFLFWYWKWVEGTDKDVGVIGMDALGTCHSWFWDDLKRDQPDLVLPCDSGLDRTYSGDELRNKLLETLMRENRGTYRFWMTSWDPVFDPVIYDGPWHMVLDGPVLELERDSEGNMTDYPRASAPENVYLFRSLLGVSRVGLAPFEEEIYNRYAAACYNLAVYFTREDMPDRAIEFTGLCLQFVPDYSPGPRMRSPIELLVANLYKAGDLPRATEILTDLLRQEPSNSLYHAAMAEIHLTRGDTDSALRELEIAVRLDPRNDLIRAIYEDLKEKKDDSPGN